MECQGRIPPLGPMCFIFMQFLGKMAKIVHWSHAFVFGTPSLGNPGTATASDATRVAVAQAWGD